MTTILLAAIVSLLVASVFLLIALLRKSSQADPSAIGARLDALQMAQEHTDSTIKEQSAQIRDEHGKAAREQRQELGDSFRGFADSVLSRLSENANLQDKRLDAFADGLATFAKASGERLDAARAESATGAKQLREEVLAMLKGISETMVTTLKEMSQAEKSQLETFSGQLANLTKATSEKLDGIRLESAAAGKQLREEVIATLNGISETTAKAMGELANAQKGQLEGMALTIERLAISNESKLEAVRGTVEAKLHSIQVENTRQLDQMRQTVDERLQSTLERRLGESFKLVSERLEMVHKGLGEMQVLATGVGDLKKVLANVKTRGTWGEVQLGALLAQVLSPEQFEPNVATKEGGERVEFAIRLPGQGIHKDEIVWLPIDAKFPIEDYQRLVEAQEKADPDSVEKAGRQLEARVKISARDISDKYLNPPGTTDFGILYLPIEGLFAEVIRRPGLTELIQREWRVVVAGPTTLWSILGSLQMGFRTLAIHKRSSEVWNLLAAVKTEWSKYGEALEAVQKKLHQASETVERAQVRSRAVSRKLRGVQELPASDIGGAPRTNLLMEGNGQPDD